MRAVVLAVFLGACGGTATTEAPEARRAAILAAADAHDGTEDHVVSECAVCGLSMPGDAGQAVTVDGYEVHMCSDSCKSQFEGHTDETIESLGRLID